jgi:hypothetical protein
MTLGETVSDALLVQRNLTGCESDNNHKRFVMC